MQSTHGANPPAASNAANSPARPTPSTLQIPVLAPPSPVFCRPTYAAVAATPIVHTRQREPTSYLGRPDEDATQWLKDFDRVAAFNHWNDEAKTANVVFYLGGTARTWYDNAEDGLQQWIAFKTNFLRTFGSPVDQQQQARRTLETRAQLPGEPCEAYIQDVLDLCRKSNAAMPDAEKLQHLMKGVAEDIYTLLLALKVSTAEAFQLECRRIVQMRQTRIGAPTTFQRLPNVAAVGIAPPQPTPCANADIEGLKDTIRQLQGQMDALREMITASISTVAPAPPIYNENRESARPQSHYTSRQPQQPRTTPQRRLQSQQNEWRQGGRPICYYCERVGHVIRQCRTKMRAEGREPQNQSFQSGRSRQQSTPIWNTPAYQRAVDGRTRDYGARQANSDHREPMQPRTSSPYPRRQSRSPYSRVAHRSPTPYPADRARAPAEDQPPTENRY